MENNLPWLDQRCYKLALRHFACFARAVFRKCKLNQNMCGYLPCAMHKHQITFEFIAVLYKHIEITLKLRKVRLNDACSELQRKERTVTQNP